MKRLIAIILSAVLAGVLSLSAETPLKGKILKIDFHNQIAERGGSDLSVSLSGISNQKSYNLLSVERAIDAAAKDDKIALIFLKTDGYASGMAAAEELRHSLERFRSAGKKVIAYNTGYTTSAYYLASVADKVVLNPSGEGSMTGLASSLMFYKDLIDALGVNVQLILHGKYKSAGEPYIRSDISDENRRQYEQMLGSIWNVIKTDISASRGIGADEIDRFANELALGDAPTWLSAGLVDDLWDKGEMEEYLCGLFGAKTTDLLKVVDVANYASKLKKGPAKNKIAVIFANGSIGSGSDVDGVKMAETIAKVRADSTVKAIVWRVNSPGGEVVSSDLIRTEIEAARKVKPVIASYGSYAASGGYWISSSSDRIFTDNTTLTGSIGVFGLVPVLGDAIRKNLKVNPVSITTHPHADMMQGMREFNDEERSWMQANIDSVYTKFVTLVSESRGLEWNAVDEIAQGRVWAGADALGLGLVDQIGTGLDAIEYAAKQVGLSAYQIVYYPEVKSMTLKNMLSGKQEEEPLVETPFLTVDLPGRLAPAAQALRQAGELIGDVSRPTIQARMPYVIDF